MTVTENSEAASKKISTSSSIGELLDEVLEEDPAPRASKVLDYALEHGWRLHGLGGSFVMRLNRDDAEPFFASWKIEVDPETGKKSWRFAGAKARNGQALAYGDIITYLDDPSVIYPEED